MNKKYLVCIDPGHGPGCVNGSPDGTYKEREFAWDMGQRITALLEKAGMTVLLTRMEDAKPSLTQRATVSNNMGADLFVSLHSNAAGGSGWSSPSGLLIYTSQPGENAGRNKAARAILKRMEEAGVKLFSGGLSHNGYTVLTATSAPAVLIEYGFHTSQADVPLLKDTAHRDRLAKATVEGILDWLGVREDRAHDVRPYEGQGQTGGSGTRPYEGQGGQAEAGVAGAGGDPATAGSGAVPPHSEDMEEGRVLDNTPDPWAAGAVSKAIAAGVIRGSDTGDLALHSTVDKQTLAVILDNLGLLEG